jgi:hypothetical protein
MSSRVRVAGQVGVTDLERDGFEMRDEGSRKRVGLGIGMALVMTGFVLTTVGTTVFADRHHPVGMELYVLAALPTIPIVCMLAVLGVYIARVKDEFQRAMMVRSLLWAIGGTLVVGVFAGYVRAFGGGLKLPAFTELVAFWVMYGIAHVIQMRRYRVASDD